MWDMIQLEAYTQQIQQMMTLTQSLAARPEPPPPAARPTVGEPVASAVGAKHH